ncbi:MAG: hypothetical protein ACOC1K_03590 [Nanoarchaeota archaeon]
MWDNRSLSNLSQFNQNVRFPYVHLSRIELSFNIFGTKNKISESLNRILLDNEILTLNSYSIAFSDLNKNNLSLYTINSDNYSVAYSNLNRSVLLIKPFKIIDVRDYIKHHKDVEFIKFKNTFKIRKMNKEINIKEMVKKLEVD